MGAKPGRPSQTVRRSKEGQYAHDLGAMCVCGHTAGEHTAVRFVRTKDQPCLVDDCNCSFFTKRPLVSNPAWGTDAIANSWEIMNDAVQPAWLPRLDSVMAVPSSNSHITAQINEYGCGKFGCVYPTYDPAVVMKITTDETEAEFATQLANSLPAPICVAYYAVIALNQFHDVVSKGRAFRNRIYVLWREAASQVGMIRDVLGEQAFRLIEEQHKAAQKAWLSLRGMEIQGERGRPHEISARLLSRWVGTCEVMARQREVPELRPLGDGMVEAWTQQRIFFGDVHDGNVGIVHRSDGGHWVITDPGYASVIDPDI